MFCFVFINHVIRCGSTPRLIYDHVVKIMELIWNQGTGKGRKRVIWYMNVCMSFVH